MAVVARQSCLTLHGSLPWPFLFWFVVFFPKHGFIIRKAKGLTAFIRRYKIDRCFRIVIVFRDPFPGIGADTRRQMKTDNH